MQETWVQSRGWEDPLEKGRASRSSIPAWRIPQGHTASDMTERPSLHKVAQKSQVTNPLGTLREGRGLLIWNQI